MKAYKGSKWAIVKEEWWIEGAACEHGLCERLHTDRRTGKRTCPDVRRVEWLIMDIETNERSNIDSGSAYALRRDAVYALELHFTWLEKTRLLEKAK
jgi:hypothetical protein